MGAGCCQAPPPPAWAAPSREVQEAVWAAIRHWFEKCHKAKEGANPQQRVTAVISRMAFPREGDDVLPQRPPVWGHTLP